MKYDILIVGQGIAGSTLAVELLQRGVKVLVLDRLDEGSSSRVAAGLVTPLTGKGLNPGWRQSEYLPVAESFYSSLERKTAENFYHPCEVVRVFKSARERDKWRGKSATHSQWGQEKTFSQSGITAEFGGLQMSGGAWLDTQKFITVVKQLLTENNAYREANFSEADVKFTSGGVIWDNVSADKIILCQGAYGLNGEGWLGNVTSRCAKGEILTLKIDGLPSDTRYHAAGWLAARGDDTWKAGATYDWQNLNSKNTEAGEAEVLTKLSSWFKHPVEVLAQEAGVRPIIRNSRPVIGFHHAHNEIGFFNGLGSKGSLMAPAVAGHFADVLTGQSELDPELSIPFPEETAHTPIPTGNLLKKAHALVADAVSEGDVVIDATVGNGHDTLYLTTLVGARGKVIGFDIQQQAIESAGERLSSAGVLMDSYDLHQRSHDEIQQVIHPTQVGQGACVMFNLGYLPGADKSVITLLDSTLKALQQSVTFLKSGGLLSVMCYPGHAGGDNEAAEVQKWMMALPQEQFHTSHYVRESHTETTPFLLTAHKK